MWLQIYIELHLIHSSSTLVLPTQKIHHRMHARLLSQVHREKCDVLNVEKGLMTYWFNQFVVCFTALLISLLNNFVTILFFTDTIEWSIHD